jgi:hypothetical protein
MMGNSYKCLMLKKWLILLKNILINQKIFNLCLIGQMKNKKFMIGFIISEVKQVRPGKQISKVLYISPLLKTNRIIE